MGILRIDRITGPPAPLVVAEGPALCSRCHRARSPFSRFVGLLATGDLSREEGLWIERCSRVHTFGLRAPIGVAFLDADGRVLRVVDPLPRWRMAAAAGARSVVECRSGVLQGLAVGGTLRISR